MTSDKKDIMRQLQSKIDKDAHAISIAENYPDIFDKEEWKVVRETQAFEKRLYGYIVSLRRMAKDAQYATYGEI